MTRWRWAWAAVAAAAVVVAPATPSGALSVPRAYAATQLATIPVPDAATPVTSLPASLPGDADDMGAGPQVVRASQDYLVPTSVDLSSYYPAHHPAGSSATSSGYASGDGPTIYEMQWTLPCPSRHVPQCEGYANFATVGGHQELRVGVALVWRPITVVQAPTSGVETLTGYGTTSLSARSSHPVTVTLTSSQRSRVAVVVATLKGAPSGMCMEDSALYVIAIHAGSASGPVTWRASADECPGILSISWSGHSAALDARSCPLARTVRALLPAAARATRTALKSCL